MPRGIVEGKITADAAKQLRERGKGVTMELPSERSPESSPADAEAHVKSAYQILKALQAKVGEHPEIGEAVTKLEMALNVLAIKTGGVL